MELECRVDLIWKLISLQHDVEGRVDLHREERGYVADLGCRFQALVYNASIRGNGEELTVAHGRWRSRAHTRYHRWSDLEVAGITAAMVGV